MGNNGTRLISVPAAMVDEREMDRVSYILECRTHRNRDLDPESGVSVFLHSSIGSECATSCGSLFHASEVST